GRLRIETGVETCRRTDLADTVVGDDLQPGEYVYLDVTDTGCGMAPEEIRRIFDPFYTTKFAGRGLGLAATLGIVRAHNGTVQVDSTPGEGTSLRFYFPALQTNQPFSPNDRAEPFPVLDAEMILVADDQPDIREFVEETLTGEDIAVLKAVDGEDAVEAFRHHHEELSAVLLDLTMPGTDSREVVARFRDVDATTPIILSSGYSEQSSLEEAIAGVASFLQKPYGPEDLLRTLDEAIGGR
ncbi:MAG: ATP-binding protein, partial [Bradymonadaceae bacterium]